MIYLDYHASTPVDPRVLEKMGPYHLQEFGNPHSTNHQMGWRAADAVEAAASQVGSLLQVDSDEIVFTSGATEANNLALFGVARGPLGGKRNKLLMSSIEHKSVLAVGRALQKLGFEVCFVPVNHFGEVDLNRLVEALDDRVLLVSIGLVNSEIGTIQNIHEIARCVRAVGALLHTDAAQGPWATRLENIVEQADLVSVSAHKMYGPKGIGALYIRRELQSSIEPIIYGGGQQANLRSGTMPTALCVGFGAAAAITAQEEELLRPQIMRLRDQLIKALASNNVSITLNGPSLENRHPGNANLLFSGYSAYDILTALQTQVAASIGSACISGINEPSHVLRAIGLSGEDAESSIRFCVGRGTTEEDIQGAIGLIHETLSNLSRDGLKKKAV